MEKIPKSVWILSTIWMDDVLASIEEIRPHFMVLTVYRPLEAREFDQRVARWYGRGNVPMHWWISAKDKRHPMAVMMVGHMTKSERWRVYVLRAFGGYGSLLGGRRRRESLRVLLSRKPFRPQAKSDFSAWKKRHEGD